MHPISYRSAMSRSMQRALKRLLDILVSASGMILLAPGFAMIGIAIWVIMGQPILFRQRRPGYRGRPFTLLKFRTLTDARDSEGALLPDAARLTPLGRFLRRWSLDELPQLWNILKAEMSLVGPRPLLIEYLEKYTPEQARRHEMRPGLTGWAQVHGRQDLVFSTRLKMDVWYVDHWNVWLDLRVILLTLLKFHRLSSVGASPDLDKTDDLGLFPLIRKQRNDPHRVSLP